MQTTTSLDNEELKNENQIIILPNPANNEVNISISTMTKNFPVKYKVNNIMGEKIAFGVFSNYKNKLTYQSWTNGIYFISLIDDNNKISNHKVIIEH